MVANVLSSRMATRHHASIHPTMLL
jgi:hypothetical protein